MNKRVFILFLVLLATLSLKAQKDSLLYLLEKQKDLEFPVFINKERELPIEKINQTLQLLELHLLKDYEDGNLFRNYNLRNYNRPDISVYTKRIKTKIMCNDRRILSIQIKESSCGATCGYGTNYYNFNVQNGDLFNLKDLFTPSGYILFQKYASNKRIQAFKKELLKIEESKRVNFLGIPYCYEIGRVA